MTGDAERVRPSRRVVDAAPCCCRPSARRGAHHTPSRVHAEPPGLRAYLSVPCGLLGTVGLGGRRPPVLLQKVSSFVRAFVDARRQVRRNARTSISPGRVCPALPFWPLLLRPRLLHSEPAFRAGLALAQSPKAKRDRSAAWRIGGAWICPSKTCRVTVDPTMCMSIGETDATCAADHRGVRRCWYNYMVACG